MAVSQGNKIQAKTNTPPINMRTRTHTHTHLPLPHLKSGNETPSHLYSWTVIEI